MDTNAIKQELILHKLDLAALERAWSETKKEKYTVKIPTSVYSVTDLLMDKKGVTVLNRSKISSMVVLVIVILFWSFLLSLMTNWAMPQAIVFWIGGIFLSFIFAFLIDNSYKKYDILYKSYLKEEKIYLEQQKSLLKKIKNLEAALKGS